MLNTRSQPTRNRDGSQGSPDLCVLLAPGRASYAESSLTEPVVTTKSITRFPISEDSCRRLMGLRGVEEGSFHFEIVWRPSNPPAFWRFSFFASPRITNYPSAVSMEATKATPVPGCNPLPNQTIDPYRLFDSYGIQITQLRSALGSQLSHSYEHILSAYLAGSMPGTNARYDRDEGSDLA